MLMDKRVRFVELPMRVKIFVYSPPVRQSILFTQLCIVYSGIQKKSNIDRQVVLEQFSIVSYTKHGYLFVCLVIAYSIYSGR